jgi:hypothetical protein
MDKDQKMFFSKSELELTEQTFKDNDELLYALRSFFFQFELTDKEKDILKVKDNVLKLIKKFILPELAPDVPLYQQRHLYAPLFKIQDYNQEGALSHIYANDILIDYMTQMFIELESGEPAIIKLESLPNPLGIDQEPMRYTNMLAYLKIISFIDERIGEIKNLANPPKEPTEEEKLKAEQMNSSK